MTKTKTTTRVGTAMRILLAISCCAVMMIGGTIGSILVGYGMNQDHVGTYLLCGAGAAVLILLGLDWDDMV